LTAAEAARVRRFLGNLAAEWAALPVELRREFLTRIALDRVLIRHTNARIWCRLIWRTGRVQEIVIHRPFVDERVRWTEAEEAILREHFRDARPARLRELLPGRTWMGIEKHGHALGLERRPPPGGAVGPRPRWQAWEIELVRRYYDARLTKAELRAALPRRGWSAIICQAGSLGLRWVERQHWEPNLRWEEAPAGAFDSAANATTVSPEGGRSMACRRTPS
jgi:hypothetical protein